jgi:dihydroxy-acid dehydratase
MKKYETNIDFMQSPENARSRALLKGMGYTTQELKQPRIGVANSWGETSPGHFHLRALGDAVKAGIWQAGGTPFEFNSFAQCPMDIGKHGIRYDTATRDIVAAEIEAAAHLHMFDGMVMISSCDKNVPANLLAACRLNIPVIVVTGGPMLAGRHGEEDTDTTTLDAACWAFGVGKTPISRDEMDQLEDSVCPGPGSCALLGTANTMQCLTEALGLSLPGVATTPAVSALKLR